MTRHRFPHEMDNPVLSLHKPVDPCLYCGESTALGAKRADGSLICKFVNRIPADDGWACAECAGFECDACGEGIYLDHEVRVDFTDDMGKWHYGNYHDTCHDPDIHGPAQEG